MLCLNKNTGKYIFHQIYTKQVYLQNSMTNTIPSTVIIFSKKHALHILISISSNDTPPRDYVFVTHHFKKIFNLGNMAVTQGQIRKTQWLLPYWYLFFLARNNFTKSYGWQSTLP
jgi:hypothetical protein